MGRDGQRGFEDLGAPLHEVTFAVIDLETTGGSPGGDAITEIGAVKLRGGECLGTFQTLVNPGQAIPPAITVLTGITQAMVLPAPRIAEVLPTLLEFVGDAVIVGHNVRFDVGFLDAALISTGRARLANTRVDTCALARRLVRDEVPNCKLGTLAERLRLDHRPNHRALDDALATGDLLHLLLERAGGLGVLGLDDLVALPKMSGHAQAPKLRLTADLPRKPGVYLFRDRGGRVLYVGKAANLRSRVRSYFSGDDRRKIGQLLRETDAVDHVVCAGQLDAAVLETRLIHALTPRFNRQAKDWRRHHYLRLTLHEPFPRLSVVRTARADGDLYLGPLSSAAFAKRVAEAIETAAPLRRCTNRISSNRLSGRPLRDTPCTAAQLGVATCPCAGLTTEEQYAVHVERVVRGLTTEPDLLLAPLAARMTDLAGAHRFEEAADVRERAAALAAAIDRQRRLERLRGIGRLVVHAPGDGSAELRHGVLVSAWNDDGELRWRLPGDLPDMGADPDDLATPAPGTPLPRHLADELTCVARWLDSRSGRLEIEHCDGDLDGPPPILPAFQPRKVGSSRAA